METQQCVGGMRNPRQSCRKLLKLRATGVKVRRCIEQFLNDEKEAIDLVSLLGSDELEDVVSDASKRVRQLTDKLSGRIFG